MSKPQTQQYGRITDPLEWQKEMDCAPAPINEKGAARFWHTVESLLHTEIICDGQPDCSSVEIKLTPECALKLSADGNFIEYGFVPLRKSLRGTDTDMDYGEQKKEKL